MLEDFTAFMWTARCPMPTRVRLEVYCAPERTAPLQARLRALHLSNRQHAPGTVRIDKARSVAAFVELVDDRHDVVAAARAYAAAWRKGPPGKAISFEQTAERVRASRHLLALLV